MNGPTKCPRCETKVPALAQYPVGATTVPLCLTCWGMVTGRQYWEPADRRSQAQFWTDGMFGPRIESVSG